jgi:hypothetical protein
MWGMEVHLLELLTSTLDESEREDREVYYNKYYFGRENQAGIDYFGSLGVNEKIILKLKNTLFSDVRPCSLIIFAEVSEERTTFLLRAEE